MFSHLVFIFLLLLPPLPHRVCLWLWWENQKLEVYDDDQVEPYVSCSKEERGGREGVREGGREGGKRREGWREGENF